MRDSLVSCIKRDLDSIATGAYEPVPGFYASRIEGYRQMAMALTQEQRAELSPEQLQLVEAKLATYCELLVDAELLEEAVAAEVAAIYAVLKDAGVEKTDLPDGTKLTEVGGDSSKFDKQKFVLLGGDLAVYNAAITKKPKKKYLLITLPGAPKKDKPTDE